MKLSSEEKRKNYFKNNPLVYQLYQEIKQENAAGGGHCKPINCGQ